MPTSKGALPPGGLPAHSRILWGLSMPIIRGLSKALFSLKIEQEGVLPPPPFVVAANHYSHFDSPLIAASMRTQIRYLALEDLFGVSSVLDWLISGYGAISTPRYRLPITAVRIALDRLEAGEVVGVFPEATRVSHWGILQPKRGAAWLALRAQVPLVPVAVIGTGRAFGLENRLRFARTRIVIGRPIEPTKRDATVLTGQWADWMTAQIERFPDSEVKGPRRSHFSGT